MRDPRVRPFADEVAGTLGNPDLENELREALEDGTLVRIDDDPYREFVVAEVIAPGIELGWSERREPCRYPDHRPSDWRTRGGRMVCGTCHPPAPGAAER